MRKLILSCILTICGVIPLWSQEGGIEVVGFRLLENDLTANTHGTSKKDGNGETAALIKIVSPEKGFRFQNGSLGIVGTEQDHVGETWLYLPRRSQKLTIMHPKFGVKRDYYFPITIDGAETYEMLLDIGTGRYVTITANRANADVTIDGEYVGKAPIYNRYMNFGTHTVFARNDRWEGTLEFDVLPNDDKTKGQVKNIMMRDMSDHYGEVTVNVEKDAEIYFENRLVGTGTWKTELREGNYYVETKKADCDPARTNFTVVAQKKNEIKANAPMPHIGYLRLVTRPSDATALYYGNRRLSVEEPNLLPVGTYQVDFSKKGYVTRSVDYTVARNATTTDTIILERIKYVKPLAFYLGAAYTVRSLFGATGILGAVIKGHDIQASYTFGLNESDPVYWEGDMNTATKYKMNSISVKYGYQISLARKLALTPQVGYIYNTLTANAAKAGNTIYGDGASSQALSIGAKFTIVPVQHIYLYIAPEYSFKLSQDDKFKAITESSNFKGEGFVVHAGLLVSF